MTPSTAACASKRAGPDIGKIGRSALDEHSRLACTEALDDGRAVIAVAFRHRAVAFFPTTASPRSAAS
ncbi:hypothetical protein [Streptosporangium sp. 'caverna']|uniref:hypothetical protein n=1 Tax=Streptosporangium sp. 'caverna' TaxID=2202249 RepID=UPI000D7E1653|nr:hypothetical protein DKM19_10525 [Streptosporangium sp. 'caverna']